MKTGHRKGEGLSFPLSQDFSAPLYSINEDQAEITHLTSRYKV